jgi:membrane-bound serine protease (ClpP class)
MRRKYLIISITFLILATFLCIPVPAQTSPPQIEVLDISNMIINPVVAEIINQGITKAKNSDAECLIIRLDTPGGLLETTQGIVKKILNSEVPVVVYVWPSGARAASAGVFITLASHVAAMAPSTHIGAAHPVLANQSWGKIDEEMKKKITNDTVIWIKTIAEKRNRNRVWAAQAVEESVSISEKEALNKEVIDIVATDLNDLIEQLNGREIITASGTLVLNTKNAKLNFIPLSWRQKFLNAIINPNIAYLLFTLGFLGLLYEITHPGFGFPGLAGIICLLLAFYAFQILPTNYAGLALIVFGLIMFVAEAFTPTFGAFTLGGITAVIFGSIMLYNQPYEFLRVSLKIIIPIAVALGAISVFLVSLAVKAHRKKSALGAKGLVGQTAKALSRVSARKGKVFIHGEIWNALSDEKIAKGDEVVIVEIKGLTLKVRKK